MKIKKENVVIAPGRSFKVFSPRLKNYFFWHYHPEFELVYVKAKTGIRHVGSHVSSYDGSDLVLIGSNVPHLNFDYGVETEYDQVVVQFKESFVADVVMNTPEFDDIRRLFSRAYRGIAFSGETKRRVAGKLEILQVEDNFQALLRAIEILQILAESREGAELNTEDTSVKLFLNDKIRMGTVYEYVRLHFNDEPNVNEIAGLVHLSMPAFCRYFKRQTNMTFTEFLNQYRITQAKTELLKGFSVADVCYACGFESLSYFNKLFKKLEGMGPLAFKKRYIGRG
ncbi:MAG: helix-turn-helix domain-containing protein [Bacteroidetes bacterium]|nr:helix-turn-helix domain-containing protein [Bacteroidota bacterium]